MWRHMVDEKQFGIFFSRCRTQFRSNGCPPRRYFQDNETDSQLLLWYTSGFPTRTIIWHWKIPCPAQASQTRGENPQLKRARLNWATKKERKKIHTQLKHERMNETMWKLRQFMWHRIYIALDISRNGTSSEMRNTTGTRVTIPQGPNFKAPNFTQPFGKGWGAVELKEAGFPIKWGEGAYVWRNRRGITRWVVW